MMVMMTYGRLVLKMHTYISIFTNTYMYNAQSEFAAVSMRTLHTQEHRRSRMERAVGWPREGGGAPGGRRCGMAKTADCGCAADHWGCEAGGPRPGARAGGPGATRN